MPHPPEQRHDSRRYEADEEVQTGLPRGTERRENLLDHAFHVRQLRDFLPGDRGHRLPIEDGAPGGRRRQAAALGHGGAGEVQVADSIVHKGFQRRCRGV